MSYDKGPAADDAHDDTEVKPKLVLGPLGKMVVENAVWEALEAFAKRFPGIEGALVRFSGSGDSGDMESGADLIYRPRPGTNHVGYDALNEAFARTKIGEDKLEAFIHAWAQDVMDKHGDEWPDWYNNDGGDGSIEFIIDGEPENSATHYRRGVHVTVNQNIVTQETTTFTYGGAVDEDEVEVEDATE